MTALQLTPFHHPGLGGDLGFTSGPLRMIVSEAEDHGPDGQWRHVSVSCTDRLPTWEELGSVREQFFDPAATVFQVMPPRSSWVSQHEFCLHLWQRLDQDLLPHGLHRTVGMVGCLPFDGTEKALKSGRHDLAAHLHNLLRSRGDVTLKEIWTTLRPYFENGTEQQFRHEVRTQLDALARTYPAIRPPADGVTWRWRPA